MIHERLFKTQSGRHHVTLSFLTASFLDRAIRPRFCRHSVAVMPGRRASAQVWAIASTVSYR